MPLRTPFGDSSVITPSTRSENDLNGWIPIDDPEGRYSTGIGELDRLLGSGFQRGSLALITMDEPVGLEDLDLLLFPTFLNKLYQSRGMIAMLPSRDSPRAFRTRLTRYVTRRRFDRRVRVVDYVGEDEGHPYVVNLNIGGDSVPPAAQRKARTRATAMKVEAERGIRGERRKPFIELTAFEVFESLLGTEKALQLFFQGIKRARQMQHLAIGLLGPGLSCAAAVRRMADTEFALHREEVGLIIRGIRPTFPGHVVIRDPRAGAPHVAFVPQPT
jgi:hypothetical protein